MTFNKLIVYLFLSVFVTHFAYSQDEGDNRSKLAESYEKSGDYKNAARLYSELYDEQPGNDAVFYGLVRSFKGLNQFGDLLPIIEKRLNTKKNAETYAIYGEILWRTGKSAEANKAWDNALSAGGQRNPDTYLDVANSQVSLRLFDKAVATLEKGRSDLKNNGIFSDQLSQLYIATGDFSRGTAEVLNLFEQTNNIGIAQGRLSALLSNPNASVYVNSLLKDKADGDNINYKRLYAWFLRSTKRFDEAFEVYKRIDALQASNGQEILNFANSSSADGQVDIALKAYEYVIDMGRKNPNILNALFGYARTLETRLKSQEKVPADKITEIIDRYYKIIDEFGQTTTADDARFRIAYLYLDQLNNQDKAISELNNLIAKDARKPLTAAANNLLGEIYIMQDKLDEAEKVFKQVIIKYSRISPDDKDLAQYRLAEIEFFKGELDSAKEHFGLVSANTNSDNSNDALDRITLIEQNKEMPRAVTLFGQAELRERQKKYDEAIKLLGEAASLAEGSELGEKSIVKSAKIEYNRKNYDKAREIMSKLIEKNPETIYADYAAYFIGDTYFAQQNTDQALKYYTDLLARFPKSIYLDEARTKIKNIRAGNRM